MQVIPPIVVLLVESPHLLVDFGLGHLVPDLAYGAFEGSLHALLIPGFLLEQVLDSRLHGFERVFQLFEPRQLLRSVLDLGH